MPYALGWRYDIEDRAWLEANQTMFDTARFRAVRAPAEIDPRPHLVIYDQGQLGSCSGHSRATCEEVLNFIKTGGDKVRLSRMYAYLTNQQECGCFGSDNGATISGSVQAAMKEGICREDLFPYTGEYTTDIPAEAASEGRQHLVRSHAVLRGYQDALAYLQTGTGVIQIGVPVGRHFQNCTGVLGLRDAESDAHRPEGGHALALVGYTAAGNLILVNSWGTDWGDNGTCEVQPEVIDFWGSRIGRGDCELVGISDLAEYPDEGRGADWSNVYAG